MKRKILVMAMTMLVLALVVAVPALAQTPPAAPQCGWYANADATETWWEYWCWWPRWGWEYVFWTY